VRCLHPTAPASPTFGGDHVCAPWGFPTGPRPLSVWVPGDGRGPGEQSVLKAHRAPAFIVRGPPRYVWCCCLVRAPPHFPGLIARKGGVGRSGNLGAVCREAQSSSLRAKWTTTSSLRSLELKERVSHGCDVTLFVIRLEL